MRARFPERCASAVATAEARPRPPIRAGSCPISLERCPRGVSELCVVRSRSDGESESVDGFRRTPSVVVLVPSGSLETNRHANSIQKQGRFAGFFRVMDTMPQVEEINCRELRHI